MATQAGTDPPPQPAEPQLAAALTAFVGGLLTIMGLAHLQGVLTAAANKGYDYDMRLAGLLLVGSALVFGGLLCLSAVLGLARAQRIAWNRAISGTILLLIVTVLTSPLQPNMAPGLSVFVGLNLFALLVAWRRLEPADVPHGSRSE
ncbi:MAG TPA: hypothetical protein VFC71_10445 [Candidatus Polarisedimenticolia bacterium]|nr:hypothetical protein [Candidatus Polarisedimenticolia bacterium]